jgi:hypothetical protein
MEGWDVMVGAILWSQADESQTHALDEMKQGLAHQIGT